ncbi:MAG: mechanosensitive ion channel family protein, partial [Candidatus Binataceae bacterium]
MNATALQNVLGLYAIAPDERFFVELLLAVIASLIALAMRRRRHIMRPAGFSMIAAGFACDIAASSAIHLINLADVLGGLAVVIFAWGIIRILLDGADATVRRRRHHFSTIFKDLLMLLLFALVVAVVLRVDFKVNVAPLLATSAVLTVVLGFALQETLGNIFSGLTLQLEKPFEPGDWIRSANHLGRVLGIGWRSTTIVTFANERLDIPNALLAKDVLINYANEHVADEIWLGISYLAPPNRVREVILGAMRDIPEVLRTPAPEVYAWEYGESAIRYRVRYWLADYGMSEDVRDRVTTALWYVLRRNGLEIPFPIRTLELRQTHPERNGDGSFERELAHELRRV